MALVAWPLFERLARPGEQFNWLLWLSLLPPAMLTIVALRTQMQLPEFARRPAFVDTLSGNTAALAPTSKTPFIWWRRYRNAAINSAPPGQS